MCVRAEYEYHFGNEEYFVDFYNIILFSIFHSIKCNFIDWFVVLIHFLRFWNGFLVLYKKYLKSNSNEHYLSTKTTSHQNVVIIWNEISGQNPEPAITSVAITLSPKIVLSELTNVRSRYKRIFRENRPIVNHDPCNWIQTKSIKS